MKALFNERNQRVKSVGPSQAATLLGFNGAPQAGDQFHVMETEQEAREIANKREQLQREQDLPYPQDADARRSGSPHQARFV